MCTSYCELNLIILFQCLTCTIQFLTHTGAMSSVLFHSSIMLLKTNVTQEIHKDEQVQTPVHVYWPQTAACLAAIQYCHFTIFSCEATQETAHDFSSVRPFVSVSYLSP